MGLVSCPIVCRVKHLLEFSVIARAIKIVDSLAGGVWEGAQIRDVMNREAVLLQQRESLLAASGALIIAIISLLRHSR